MINTVIVFGGGKFGASTAINLEKLGASVVLVDKDMDIIQKMAPYVNTAIQTDINDPSALEELGISNFDAAVVAIGSNLEASIVATLACQEAGLDNITAKAASDMQARILKRLGAHNIIFPELESGERLAKSLKRENILEIFQINDHYSISEIHILQDWRGKSLNDLKLRQRHNINVIALKRGEDIFINPNPDEVLRDDDNLIVISSEKDIIDEI